VKSCDVRDGAVAGGGGFVRADNGEATAREEVAKMAETMADVKSMLIILIGREKAGRIRILSKD